MNERRLYFRQIFLYDRIVFRGREMEVSGRVIGDQNYITFSPVDGEDDESFRLYQHQVDGGEVIERPLFRCETNTPEMAEEIKAAFDEAEGTIQTDFEHGQWWVTILETGAQWSVNDAAGDEFSFEQVSEGEEEYA